MTHSASPFGPGGPVAGRASAPSAAPPGIAERLFSASALGQGFGARSQADFAEGQALDARSQGLTALTHALEADQGQNPQRILLEFLTSPPGMKALREPSFLPEVTELFQSFKLTPAAAARRDLARQADVPVEEVADIELQRLQNELLTTETRERNERARQLGVEPKVLAQVDQALKQAELDDPTGSQRAFAGLAKQLGVTESQLGQLNLDRKREELIQLERRNRLSDKARERQELETEAGVAPGTLATAEVQTATLEPAVREMIQLAAQTGKTKDEQRELIKRAAVAKLAFETGGRTQEERAFLALVEGELLTRIEAELRLAGVIELVPVLNAVGEETGEYDLVNTLSGEVRRLSPSTDAQRTALQGMVTEGAAPTGGESAEDEAASLVPKSRVPASIIRPAGAVSLALRAFYGVAGQVVTPKADNALRQRQANTLTLIGSRFRDYATGEGRLLKLEAAMLAPIVENLTLFKGANEVGASLLAMHDFIDNDEAGIVGILRGSDQDLLTDQSRQRLSGLLVAAKMMRAQLPTRASLDAELLAVQSGDPLGAAEEALEGARGVLSGAVPGESDGAVEALPAASGGPPANVNALPGGERPGVALPPAGATPPGGDDQTFFQGIQQFVPPALRVRVDEFDALIEVVPLPIQRTLDQITNLGVGFNVALTEFLGIAPEALNEALVLLGTDGFLDEPGDAVQALQNAFDTVGFIDLDNERQLDSFAAALGRDTFNATVAAAVFLAAAPVLAAAEGSTLLQYVGKTAMQFARDFTAMFAATNLGAAVGPRITVSLFDRGDMSPELRSLLETAGAFVGGGLASAPFAGAQALLKPGILKRGFMKKPTTTETGEMDISPLRAFAEGQIEKDRIRVNSSIRAIIEKFAPNALAKGEVGQQFTNPQKATALLGAALRRIEKGPARALERKKWAAIPGKQDMTPGLRNIVSWARTRISKTGADSRAAEIPEGAVRRIMAWEQVAEDGTKTFVNRTVSDLIKLRSIWLTRVRDPKTTTQHRAFYQAASKRLLTEIERQFPEDKTTQEALAYSRWLNDKFFGGALKGFMIGRSGGDFDPEKAIATLVQSFRVAGKGEPSATVISDIAVKLQRPQLMETARSFIRNEFGAIAQKMDEQAAQAVGPGLTPGQRVGVGRRAGATAGQKFLNSPAVKAFSEAFPAVKADADTTLTRLSSVMKTQLALDESAFAAFAGTNTRDAVQALMASPNRVAMVRELTSRMAPSAKGVRANELDALRGGMIDWLFRATNIENIKPSTVLAQLNLPGTRQVFRMVYNADEMRRLDRLIASASAVQGGRISMVARVFDRTIGTGAKILGAAVGRKFDTGTIQVPGMMSQLSGDIVSRLVGFGTPSRLLAMAMTDPKMERLLLSRVPQNLVEVKKMTDLMRVIISTLSNATSLPSKGGEE